MTKEEQAAYAAEHYPTANLGIVPGYNPEAPGTWTEHLALLEKAGYPTVGLTEPGVTPITPIGKRPSMTAPEVTPITTPTLTIPPPPTPPVLPPTPTITPPVMPEVPTLEPYEKTPEQIAFEEMVGGKITETLEMEGRGIPEVTQAQMIQKTTDVLKSREEESLRVMRNTMERRGITNSGFVFANEQQIKSVTTVAIANNIRDVQISSAFMKMASFENAMGQAAKFLGYLADESLKAYAPKLAQWEMEAKYGLAEYGVEVQFELARAELKASYGLAGYGVEAEYGMAGYQAQVQATIAQFQVNALAIMNEWQAKFDLIKMEINQAYAQDNINLANQWLQTLQDDQQAANLQIAQMEMDFAEAQSKAEARGTISGSIVNGIFAVATAFL